MNYLASVLPKTFFHSGFLLVPIANVFCDCVELLFIWGVIRKRGIGQGGRGPCLITHPTSVQTSSPSACLPTYPVPTQSQILFRIQKITQREGPHLSKLLTQPSWFTPTYLKRPFWYSLWRRASCISACDSNLLITHQLTLLLILGGNHDLQINNQAPPSPLLSIICQSDHLSKGCPTVTPLSITYKYMNHMHCRVYSKMHFTKLPQTMQNRDPFRAKQIPEVTEFPDLATIWQSDIPHLVFFPPLSWFGITCRHWVANSCTTNHYSLQYSLHGGKAFAPWRWN